jgi:hypothetical protein
MQNCHCLWSNAYIISYICYELTFIYTRKYDKINFEHTQLKPYIFNEQIIFVHLLP